MIIKACCADVLASFPWWNIVSVVHLFRPILLLLSAAFLSVSSVVSAYNVVWPTPNPAFDNGESFEEFIQPTSVGEPISGTFGGVRNNGRRFHEGIDIKPFFQRSRKGEPTDPVYAAMDGVVAHVSTLPGNSGYGRYIVIAHNMGPVEVYTLYAHLAAVGPLIRPGVAVKAGETIGAMGRSAGGYSIPRERAHLHFEVGLKYGSRFQQWYDRQQFGSPNFQKDYNGMNLAGFDPLGFLDAHKDGKANDMCDYIKSLPVAYVLRANCAEIPEITRINYGLVTKKVPDGAIVGWDISFTWYGLPTHFTPLTQADLTSVDVPGSVRLKAVDRALVTQNHSRDTVRMKNGQPTIYSGATDALEMMFGHKIGRKKR